MARRIAGYAILLGMFAVGLLLCIDVAYMLNGSLEEFPTAEQEDKVRRVTVAIALLLLLTEGVLWVLYRRLRRTAARAS